MKLLAINIVANNLFGCINNLRIRCSFRASICARLIKFLESKEKKETSEPETNADKNIRNNIKTKPAIINKKLTSLLSTKAFN